MSIEVAEFQNMLKFHSATNIRIETSRLKAPSEKSHKDARRNIIINVIVIIFRIFIAVPRRVKSNIQFKRGGQKKRVNTYSHLF